MNSEIYLLTPSDLLSDDKNVEQFKALYTQALDRGRVSCVLLSGSASNPKTLKKTVEALQSVTQERDIAFLIEDDYENAKTLGCDGVHLNDAGRYKEAREYLGTDYIVGVDCGISRHDAILVGEAGADYVAFNNRRPLPEIEDPDVREFEEGGPKGLELLTWWQTMMTPPCVSMDDIPIEAVKSHADAGADFIAVQTAIWNHRDNPATAITEVNEAIA
ncbi:thiamine phosphate synthase [Kiloniella sp. EL199]|uniref:thiamine phosphate synthase n=1 Tax=Kiloniella sp. EL199 TaxID=2107581 RepID=UPI000EA0A47F|nr:thiamine phosphate synthase [Kiloniella sp. EL199]